MHTRRTVKNGLVQIVMVLANGVSSGSTCSRLRRPNPMPGKLSRILRSGCAIADQKRFGECQSKKKRQLLRGGGNLRVKGCQSQVEHKQHQLKI